MSIHIGAKPGQIAPTVLMPGDPLRAKHFAETLLEDISCFNEVRGMYGYTGQYQGKPISIMGSGMGLPSISIYVNELLEEYDVETIIRIGTCGAIQPDLRLGDIVIALTASTDSQINKLRFQGRDFSPGASFDLLQKAQKYANTHNIRATVGSVFTGDIFYDDDPDWWKIWAEYGVLVCDMETNALYTLAAKYRAQALSILTVSDSLVSGEEASSQQRETGFTKMAEIALEISP